MDNRIDLWIPIRPNTESDIFHMENVLDLRKSIEDDIRNNNVGVVVSDHNNKEIIMKDVLSTLNNAGFSSLDFVQPVVNNVDTGFLAAICSGEYIVLAWISNLPTASVRAVMQENTVSRPQRSKKKKKFDFGESDDEEYDTINNKRASKENEIPAIAGYEVLNQPFDSIDRFDFTKCFENFPVASKKIYSSLLYAKTLAIVDVGLCYSIFGIQDSNDKDLVFNIYFSVGTSIRTFKVKFERDDVTFPNINDSKTEISPLKTIVDLNKNIEMLKCYKLISSNEDHHIIIATVESSILVHIIAKSITKYITCGNIPITSYSLEPLYMVDGNLAQINAIDSGSTVYRIILDNTYNLKIEEVIDKNPDALQCFTACENFSTMTYECIISGQIIEMRANIRHNSIFISVLFAIINGNGLSPLIHYIIANKGNLIPKNTIFGLTTGVNSEREPVSTCENIDDLMKTIDAYVSAKDDNLVKTFYDALGHIQDGNRSKIAFTLYLLACLEATGELQPENEKTITCTESSKSILTKILKDLSPTNYDLKKIYKLMSNADPKNHIVQILRNRRLP
ncbi:hypothetical protein BEWA_018300 [Theileria equi strain WA]|uniref:Uncharacterized protein n=1 Tax=Theileria equi strain WA TaxID=1537102 RepID=L0ATL5_THEEQ|nr:hypothetical protein BEWA_018300 [Theileria equi strain WA]AFZ78987.1 hypothetical protein BEWA_018300 [Theileria equi strain WA]|eukprot:XP_004828653.1 hypothetical protein BEWA_018300 [Theileria equi strain WA]